MANTYNTLLEIETQVRNCTTCELCEHRTNAVPGIGIAFEEIMIIGEGPGEKEDKAGLPFVGRSGALLDQALAKACMSRDEVFITNIVKCRPPGNRNPTQEEMEACIPYLSAQIELMNPKLIILLGKVAAEFILKRPVKITKENGKLDFLPEGICVMTVLHPAYVLRNNKPEIVHSFYQAIEDARNIAYGLPNNSLYAESS